MKQALETEWLCKALDLRSLEIKHSRAVGKAKTALRREMARKEFTIYKIREALGMCA